jgi:predicted nucleotidyltransferase
MQKTEIIKAIRDDLPYLKNKYGVNFIGLFGSFVRDQQKTDSDIDFYVDVKEPLADNFFGLWDFLEKKFNRKVDLVRNGSHLRNRFIQTIEREIIYA